MVYKSKMTAFIYLILLFCVTFGILPQQGMAQNPSEPSFAIIENNIISANTAADGGGIASYNSSPVVRNNLITENTATGEQGGGAIYIFGTSSKLTLTSNTISRNIVSSGQGGGIYVEEGEVTIVNCILWQNQDDLWNCTSAYSDVTDLSAYPGTGNISEAPLFIQTDSPDAPGYYRLGSDSPCIDAGDPAYLLAAGETDINGESRIVAGRVDIGADEAPDIRGPVISDVRFNGAILTSGTVLRDSGTFTLSATDPSAVSRVEFYVDGKLSCTDTDGADNYSCFWNIILIEDGSHTLTITSYDTLGNPRNVSYALTVALNPPAAAPVISYPVNGMVLSTSAIVVSGRAEKNTKVLLYNDNVQIGSPAPVDESGNFRLSVTLLEGANHLQAAASNRAGIGPKSAQVLVTVDTTIPQPPLNLSAQSKPGGIIGLTWGTPVGGAAKGYNLYRAPTVFSSPGEATKVNTNPITGTSFNDIAPADGFYYYGVCTVNLANLESAFSSLVSATSDRTAPRAVSIEYIPAGRYDPTTWRIAQGQVSLRLRVSETLLSTPFLTITPNGGIPNPVELTQSSETEYLGLFAISESTPNGTAYAVFSGRDLVGNRGTNVDSGATIIVDTQGPAISQIEILPRQPIRNDRDNPVSVMLTIGLNEPVKPGLVPEVSYLLSGPGRTKVAIQNLSQIATLPGQAQSWQATFTLPADAGWTVVENLQFIYRGIDDLENTGTGILCTNSFQVYQGALPPLDPPQNLIGKSLPGGKIKLSWNGVEGAAGYQLYRQAPGETTLSAYKRLDTVLEYTDNPPSDGLYTYAVASIRRENSQEAISGMSNLVQVASDSIPPGAPQALVLELTGGGIRATWEAPPDTEPFSYSLYRSNLPEITSVEGIIPILTRIAETAVVDARPSHNDHSYVVTAVDNAGNESLPSNSFYLNFDLLPVSSLKVLQSENDSPVVSWTHPGGDIAGYNVYLVRNTLVEKLNPVLLTDRTYTDTGFTGDERHYSATAVDRNDVESLARSITLPKLDATLNESERIRRGIMNRLEYIVDNHSILKVEHVRLKVQVGTYKHSSEEFSIDAEGSQDISVPVGGYADLPDLVPFTTTIEIVPQEGDLVQIARSKEIEVGDDKLVLQILNEEFVRGGLGKVWFTLENTGEEEIEIVTATGSGASPSNEVNFYLLDVDGNVLSSKAFKQNLGEGVITLANGSTVARIPTGRIFTSGPFEIPVPLTSPDQVTIQLDIAKIHFHQGQPDHVSFDGLSASHQISLKDTAYYGEVITIAPEVSTGDENIVITGRAIERSSGLPIPSVPLKVVISTGGFDRTYPIFTDSSGSFSFTLTPLPGESGIYSVRAVHPQVFDRPVQGQFVINRLTVNPSAINLNIPRNYEKAVSIQVACGEGTTAHNLRLAYEEQDQPSGSFAQGVHVTPGSPVASLGYKQTATLSFKIWADNTAETAGKIILKVKSDETGSDSWGSVLINTQFSEAKPALYFTPDHVETGIAYNQGETETITLENRGLADLNDVSLSLLSENGTSAPSWVRLNSASNQGVIPVGEKRSVSVSLTPTPATASEGVYLFYLRVSSSNYPTTDFRIYVSVTQTGIGNAIFKVADIYTGTLDKNGNLIQGLAGAKLTLQNEEVLSIEQTKNTDSLGEALFMDLPAGRYKYRITASSHQEQIGRLWIKPGITASEQVLLEYNLVTVEWEVRETTIKDKYEIVLHATYETNVPAAVVVMEPKSVTLPDMKAGDVFYGEFTITNYGFIRADNIRLSLPPSDQYYKFEFLKGMPENIGAKERITLPYRVTALMSIDQAEGGNSTGGGCSSYSACVALGYSYVCANGALTQGADRSCFTHVTGTCDVGPGGGTITIGGPGGGVISGGGGPSYQAIDGAKCLPVPERTEDSLLPFQKSADACPVERPEDTFFGDGLAVNTALREVNGGAGDLSVKVPGGNVSFERLFYEDKWHWEPFTNSLKFNYDSLGKYIESIDKNGILYESSVKYPSEVPQTIVYTHDTYKITRSESEYLWEDKSGNWKQYELSGRMVSYGTRTGVLAKLLYEESENQRLVGISDRNDRQVIWFEYDVNNRVSAIRDIDNRRVEYSYTADRLTKVKDVMGYEAFYDFDSNGRLMVVTDYAGRQSFLSYDSYGNVAKVLDREGNGYFFQYNYDEAKKEFYAEIKTSSGMVKEIWYDQDGELKRVNVNGRTIQKILKSGRNLTITDEKGNVTRKELDEWNNLTKITYPDGSSASYQYEHKFNQRTRSIDQRGNISTFEYDSQGNLIRKVEAVGTDAERTTTYTYDQYGQVLTSTIEGDANTQAATTTLTYDDLGNLSSLTDPEGNKTEFLEYDNMGNLLKMRDPRGYIWKFTYDERGRLRSQTDPLNNTASYEYNGADNRTAIINAYLKRYDFEYNDYSKVIKATDPYGKYISTEYNSDNVPTKSNDQEGKESRFEYDNEARLLKSIDGVGNQTLYYYDESQETFVSSYEPVRIDYPTYTRKLYYDKPQRLVKETDILDKDTSHTVNYTYDLVGNVISRTDEEGNTTFFDYDALNRLIKTADPLGGITERTYDDRGNLIALKDPNKGVTGYRYDRNSRLIKETRPMGEQTVYEYDAAGNRTATLDAKGQKISYEYDELNQLRKVRYFASGNHASPVKTVSFAYDNLGNLLSYDDGTTSGTYTYDDLRRKTGESVNYGPFTLSYSYEYYANGLKKSFTGPEGISYTYTYDDNNRLSLIGIPGQGQITYNAYQWNSPIKMTFPGGTTSNYTYDPLMQLKSIAVKDPRQNALMAYSYDYSPAGNITSKGTEHGNYGYQYDKLYRLSEVTNPAASNESYTYDAVGNRLTSADVPGSWNYNSNNELLAQGNVSYDCDSNGNMIRKIDETGTTAYTYAPDDMLVQVIPPNSQLITYHYDPFSRRLWKNVSGGRTYFFYADEGLIAEFGASGDEIKTYGYAPNSPWITNPLFQKIGTNYYWYESDHLTTPQKIVDTNGKVVWSSTYDGFGNILIAAAEIENNLRFPGQYYDAETGLYYNWHRYYDSVTGRYLQQDPLREDVNPYVYVGNNPIDFSDPEGLIFVKMPPGYKAPSRDEFERLLRDYGLQDLPLPIKFLLLGVYLDPGLPTTGVIACPLKGAIAAGQIHHAITTKVWRVLKTLPQLEGKFKLRDSRLVTRALDLLSHLGYQKWHRELDREVIELLEKRPAISAKEFEEWLRWRYGQADLVKRFPNGLPK